MDQNQNPNLNEQTTGWNGGASDAGQQSYYQPPQQPYYQYQQPPANSDEYRGDPRFKPLSPWAYFGYNLLFSLPLIGFIMLIVFSFSDDNINRRNFARSFFCALLLVVILFVVITIVTVAVGVAMGSLMTALPILW